ncbi:hypothetical protein [Geofilum rhodophaeum]|uniref:hypothetical protein n=1 Tax=Geofilum rhodophaeum TaxID=1965019 RepID=UPI0011BAAA5A|nr:hypothetical protein [Geofilum rhodophaeum]
MRVLLINILLLIINFSVIAQKDYYLLPENQDNYIYQRENNKLIQLYRTDLPISNLYEFYDSDKLLSINSDSTKIRFYNVSLDSLRIVLQINVPNGLKIKSLKFVDNCLLLGGDWNSVSPFYVYHLKTSEWTDLKLPVGIMFPGKAIDDVVITENKIIAVDNIIMPKYLLEYKRTDLPKLENPKIIELEPNGTYESIERAVINDKYIVLLSGTAGGYPRANSEHITILRLSDFEDGFSISSRKLQKWAYLDWTDIAIVRNKVYMGCYEKGLGRFRIWPSYFWKTPSLYNGWKNRNLGKWRIRYGLFSPKRIIDIVKCNDNKLILIYKDKDNNYKTKLR